jgi:hypothetical protein
LGKSKSTSIKFTGTSTFEISNSKFSFEVHFSKERNFKGKEERSGK